MTKDEALKQALEALEFYYEQHGEESDAKVITALRERLAQPEMQPCAGRNCGSTNPNLHSAECFEDYEKATGMNQRKPLHIGDESAAFKAWFDAWWVGDGEQGETIPTQSDKHFLTYLDQYTLGFGAWMAAKHAAHGITGEQK